jgi:hypothetical protein
MQDSSQAPTRKKFLLWSAIIVSSATVLRFFSGTSSKKKKTETVKMLTEDGTLVEMDKHLVDLMCIKRKVTNPELQAWVKNKKNFIV